MTLLLIAQVESALEQPEDACKTLEHALQLFREGGNDLGAAAVLTQLGLIRHDQKNYEQAKELYEEARTLYAKTPDREGEANTLANLGTLYYQTGKLVEAVDAYDRALDLLRPLGHAAAIASVLLNQSYALAGQQKYSEASACLKEVQQIGAQAAGLVDEGVIVQRLAELERQASESLARMRQELLADREPKAKTAAGKVGRNELCPCGSGKKYKKCCGAEA